MLGENLGVDELKACADEDVDVEEDVDAEEMTADVIFEQCSNIIASSSSACAVVIANVSPAAVIPEFTAVPSFPEFNKVPSSVEL